MITQSSEPPTWSPPGRLRKRLFARPGLRTRGAQLIETVNVVASGCAVVVVCVETEVCERLT